MKTICLIAALLVAMVACGQPEDAPAQQPPAADPAVRELPPAQPPVSPPSAPEPVPSFPSNPQRPTPNTEDDQVDPPPPPPVPFTFAATQPPGDLHTMEERIVDADLIAIARMTNVANGVETVNYDGRSGYVGTLKFTFKIKEILKSPAGSSPTKVIGMVSSVYPFSTRGEAQTIADKMHAERDTQWDDRDAVIFLASSSKEYPATAADNIYFMSLIDYFTGAGDSYSIASRELRLWLPEAQTGSGGGGGSGGARSATTRRFLTGVPEQAPAQLQASASSSDETLSTTVETPSVALSSLRADVTRLVAEQSASATLRHQRCVSEKYRRRRHVAEFAAQGRTFDSARTFGREISSASPEGTVVIEDTFKGVVEAGVWESLSELQGSNAHLFRLGELTNPEPGSFDWMTTLFAVKQTINYTYYDQPIEAVRPLPRGVYDLTWKHTRAKFAPCAPEIYRNHTVKVTVTAPAGTLHEAFFDPVTDGSAVAADSSNGQLEPTAFTDANSASASLQRIEWASDTVKVKVSPHTGLVGHRLDFIELDGSVSLSLQADDATVDAANTTLSWTVTEQPWHDGDLLMLRIKEVVPEVALIDVPETITHGRSESVTLKATGLTSSNSYSIGLSSNNNAIGFGDGCGTAGTTVSIPSGSTSHSKALTLHGCSVSSETVTASLKQGTATVATATAEVQIEASASVTVSLSPRKEQYSTETDMTVDWTDPDSCDGRYFVALYDTNGTVARHLGNHPAPQTTTLSVELPVPWDDVPNDQRSVRVTCTPTDRRLENRRRDPPPLGAALALWVTTKSPNRRATFSGYLAHISSHTPH